MSALHDIYFWADETYASYLCLPSVGADKLKDLSRRHDDARHELSSFLYVGELLISDRSRTALKELLVELSREEFRFWDDFCDDADFPDKYSSHCDKVRSIIKEHLPRIQELAKADIK